MPDSSRSPPNEGVAWRVRSALDAENLGQTEAARLAGVPRDVIHKAAVRGSVPRTREQREAVAGVLKVTPAWLWHGTGGRVPPDQVAANGAPPAPPPVSPIAPVTVANFTPDPAARLVHVTDNAFAPRARAGDFLLLTPSIDPRPGDDVFVEQVGGSTLLLEFVSANDNNTVLMRLPNGFQVSFSRNDLLSFVRVAGIVRG